MHDVACEFARAAVRSKDAQKQLARTFLKAIFGHNSSKHRSYTEKSYPSRDAKSSEMDKSFSDINSMKFCVG